MKLFLKLLFLSLVAGLILIPTQKVSAQQGDTLVVEYLDSQGNFVVDALTNAIKNDTLRPAGRVYKLRAGGIYWVTEEIKNDGWHLRIVGEPPDPKDPEKFPAVIQRVSRPDGSVTARLITGGGSITFKNIYFIGCDDAGVQTAYQPIQVDASDSRFVFDRCIFERTNFALVAWTGKNNDIIITNCVYRNLLESPPTQIWTGRGLSIWNDADTVIIENNTFFNIGFTSLQIESGAAKYLRFNHNTIVFNGRGINTTPWLYEAYFANNLLINPFWHGEAHNQTELDSPNRDPRATTSGIFAFGALPTKYGPEQSRRILFANTAAWLDPQFINFFNANDIRKQPFVGPVLKEDFLNKYENMVVRDTFWLDQRPNFPVYPSEIIPKMIENITGIRSGATEIPTYFWNLPTNPDGTVCATCPSWPLPENFSYTEPAFLLTAGTDGLPLGDLNWFPDKKAIFEKNKDQYVEQLRNLAGPIYKYDIVSSHEAEKTTLGGNAQVKAVEGFVYFVMDAGGYIEWTFDLPEGGEYDLGIYQHMRGNGMRGQHTYVNGVEIHDAAHGWGELIYDPASGPAAGIDINSWQWVVVKQSDIIEAGALTFKQGTNTVRIEKSWGWQNFAGLRIIKNGQVIKELTGADVTDYDLVQPMVEGAKWVPSWFKAVDLGSGGSISFDVNAPGTGTYALNLLYQNYSGPQALTVKVDGADKLTATLESKSDSTGLSYLTDKFSLTEGKHTITLSGSNVSLDVIQFIKVTIVSSVKDLNQIPKGYALEQNYPNPFNPTTTINFSIAKPSNVKLNVYNILGQKVVTLVDKFMGAGVYSVEFNASNLASGVYFYGIEADNFKAYKKMILLK
ncbi:MAG: T9SS type A sorting domain-containing protein [Melioribacteraceae bacterium]